MSLLSLPKIQVRLQMLLAVLLIASAQVAWVTPAEAQVAGATLSGLVTDEQGGPVANATISIKNAGTGVAREVSSNADGIYSAPNLLPGEYEVTVTATGFQTLTEKGITLTVGGQQSLNLSHEGRFVESNGRSKRRDSGYSDYIVNGKFHRGLDYDAGTAAERP